MIWIKLLKMTARRRHQQPYPHDDRLTDAHGPNQDTHMTTYDVIPDIHGQSTKLETALHRLGWRRAALGWTHPDPDRQIVFLGDFIDRGPDNAAVLKTVRQLVDTGKARAIMGNHELNALHFHTLHDGQPLRKHSPKNIKQHRSFLDQFPVGDPQTHSALNWMRGLPLFHEEDGFRAVHACWTGALIDRLKTLTGNGVLSDEQLIRAADPNKADEMFTLTEQITKGPEHPLPNGLSITDKDGTVRHDVRLQWWNATARTWREIAISVPSLDELPDEDLPEMVASQTYPADEPPVFFGHYWLSGDPVLQAPNALCLDYSAGRDGPLVTYEQTEPAAPLSLDNIRVHPPVS
jgi:Calcineurin-like phosphoesterase